MTSQFSTPKPPIPQWPAHFHVTIDVIALTISNGLLQVAVVQRDSKTSCIDTKYNGEVHEIPRDLEHHWALPGGHVHWDSEDLKQAAQRELVEETGLEVNADKLLQVSAYGALGRDPRPGRTVSIAYLAFQPMFSNPRAGSDTKRAKFMPVLDLLTKPNRFEFDHQGMVLDAIQQVRDLVLTTPIATSFCPPKFTITELREVYEVLWHEAYDRDIDSESRHRYAIQLRSYEESDEVRLLSSLSEQFDLAKMPERDLQKVTQLVLRSAETNAPNRPNIRKRFDPANFSRKVEGIPGFLEKISDSDRRSSRSGTGRPAQLFRSGSAERLDPPLRLEVKRKPKHR